jgi:hypothetical protein
MSMDELIAFVTARLDEDEAVAKGTGGDGPDGQWARREDEVGTGYGHLYDGRGEVVVYDEGAPGDIGFDHIASHDPAHVLREVEATRKLVQRFGAALAIRKEELDMGVAYLYGQMCDEAAVWSDHPDYRQEWAA